MNTKLLILCIALGSFSVSCRHQKPGAPSEEEVRETREAMVGANRIMVKKDQEKIIRAIHDGWVITFPQGTTDPGAKGRKGTAHIIKQSRCIVVPVVVDGFSKAFYKSKICRPIKLFTGLSIRFKPPMNINFNDPAETIIEQIMDAIEQTGKYRN